jgi:hypothetical protein
MEAQLAAVSQKSTIAEAFRYALTHWSVLTHFLDDGRIEIDSNVVERTIRPLALNRKNALFAGSDGVASIGPSSLRSSRHANSTVPIASVPRRCVRSTGCRPLDQRTRSAAPLALGCCPPDQKGRLTPLMCVLSIRLSNRPTVRDLGKAEWSGILSSILKPQNQRYARFTCTSRQVARSERIANTYPRSTISRRGS